MICNIIVEPLIEIKDESIFVNVKRHACNGDSTSKTSRNARAMLPKVLQPFWYLFYGPYVLLLFFFFLPVFRFLRLRLPRLRPKRQRPADQSRGGRFGLFFQRREMKSRRVAAVAQLFDRFVEVHVRVV